LTILTKDKIIDAAIDLFSENGYAQTSIRDIGQKAGIKSSSLYYHFESKEAILNYILNEYIQVVSDSKHRHSWYGESDSIITDRSRITAKEIMQFMFFKFEGPRNTRYRKLIKIICSEATRNDIVRDYFRQKNSESFNYIKSVLDSLLEAGKISKCDTAKLAGILRSISFAFMHLDSMDMQSISKDDEDIDMFSLLEYVLKLGVEDSNE